MAASTLNIDGSGNLTYIDGGTAMVLTVSVSAGTYTFTDTGSGNITLGTNTGLWSGGGTNSVSGPTPTTIAVNPTTGAASVKLLSTTVAFALNYAAGAAGVFQVCSNAAGTGNLLGIVADVTASVTAGDATITLSMFGQTTGTWSVAITSSTVTGMIGANGSTKTFHYSASGGGAIDKLQITGPNNATPAVTYTIASPSCVTSVSGGIGGNKAYNLQGVTVAGAGVNLIGAGSGADVIQAGTIAGSAAGLDGLTAANAIEASGGANSLRMDDSGSASGGGTITVAGTTTQTYTLRSGVVISVRATGGSYSNMEYDASSRGSDTIKFSNNPTLGNQTIVGGGSGTVLDLSALAGYSVAGGVVTLSNGKTITYSNLTLFPAAGGGLFRQSPLTGLGAGGPYFTNPIG